MWSFLAEPHHLSDWWPGLGGVEPDRRGVATGARWRVRRHQASLLRKAEAEDTLLVTAVEPSRRFAFELVGARLRAQVTLERRVADRTMATLLVDGPLMMAFSRSLPKTALARLHDLCQTAASM